MDGLNRAISEKSSSNLRTCSTVNCHMRAPEPAPWFLADSYILSYTIFSKISLTYVPFCFEIECEPTSENRTGFFKICWLSFMWESTQLERYWAFSSRFAWGILYRNKWGKPSLKVLKRRISIYSCVIIEECISGFRNS